MVNALEVTQPPTPPPPSMRVAAIVQSAVFDAVNGIARRYTPVHVPPAAPPGASRAAAAARGALVALFPAQRAMLAGSRRARGSLGSWPSSGLRRGGFRR